MGNISIQGSLAFALVSQSGELFFSHRSHDPLGCSFKAELRALLCCLKAIWFKTVYICYLIILGCVRKFGSMVSKRGMTYL